MTQILDNLVALLSLEQIEENLFRGMSQDLGFRQLYGGQVLGQALSAASQTVDPERHVHSMHGYFLRPGDASKPVVYQVDRVRDGGTFSTRRVTAIQKGQPIFALSTSFQTDEGGFEHQIAMPDVVGPENLPTDLELKKAGAEKFPERIRDKLLYPKPIEIRPVTQNDPYEPMVGEPIKYLWLRADGKLPDIPALHKYILAYASDFGFLTTSLLPHGRSVWQKDMQVATIDHSVWFHRDLRADEWLLYAIDSPWAGNGRGFVRGSVFNRDGQLVASATQEGLIRHREDWS